MCRTLDVSRSGYYAWQKQDQREGRKDAILRVDVAIRQAFEANKGRCGSVKVTKDLRENGMLIGKNRVADRMKALGLRAASAHTYRPATTNSGHTEPVAENILNRNFDVSSPNVAWVGDITYVPVGNSWAYLAVVIDLFSRIVVGWSLSTTLHHQFVVEALERAVWRRNPPWGLLFHSDRGIQYACQGFRDYMASQGIVQSMSRKGNCWDNAVAESFFRSLKTELVYPAGSFVSVKHAQQALFEYIEIFYNRRRRHAALNYAIPAIFETNRLCA